MDDLHMDAEGEVRNRFNFGAAPSWNPPSSSTPIEPNEPRAFPGSYPFIPEEIPEEAPQPQQAQQAAEEPTQHPERTCRICFSGAEDGRLISPCKCRGTMKYVHIHCLNSWRYASTNAKSFYECDQCKYRYNFNRTRYASVVGSLYSRLTCTILVFLFAVFLSGYVFKFILYITGARLPFSSIAGLLDLMFGIDPADQMSAYDLETWGYHTPQTLGEVFSGGLYDIAHWALGLIGLALWGFVSVMTGFGALGIHIRLGMRRRDGERRRPGRLGGFLWGIVILVGTAKIMKAIYLMVDNWIRQYQIKLETAILEVDPDRE